jgi:hypothetical protein
MTRYQRGGFRCIECTDDLSPKEESDGTTALWRRATGVAQKRLPKTRLAPASTCRENRWCDTWQDHFTPPAPPPAITPKYGEECNRWRYAPNAVRASAAPMTEERVRRLLDAAPKWKHAFVLFNDKYNNQQRLPFNVSKASVARARKRAEAAQPKPVEQKPIWQRADIEDLEYGQQVEMIVDGLLFETGKMVGDETAYERARRNVPSVATERRAYSDEDLAMLSRWERGLFSQVKYDSGPFPVRWTGKGGLVREDRAASHWRYLDRGIIAAATESDLSLAFSRMLLRAKALNAMFGNRLKAKTPACRAYQAASVVRDFYLYGLRISTTEMISAAIVVEAISAHLRRAGRVDWWQRTSTLDILEGNSSYEASDKFGPDASSLRERLKAEVQAIEAKFGKYCNELWEPPQTQVGPCYTISKDRISAPKPGLTERQLFPAERDALVLRYINLANDNVVRWGWGDPRAWERQSAWIRFGYKLIAGYLEDGGRILTGYWPADLEEEWIEDRRSDARVLDQALGSYFREPGLDPFDGRFKRRRFISDEARMLRVFAAAEMDQIVDDITGSS